MSWEPDEDEYVKSAFTGSIPDIGIARVLEVTDECNHAKDGHEWGYPGVRVALVWWLSGPQKHTNSVEHVSWLQPAGAVEAIAAADEEKA